MKKLNFYPEEWDRFIKECDFTDLELHIIELTRRGWFIPDIASKLYVSEGTIKRRRKSIENKILKYILVSKF